jgi:pyrroline-5-carboxylate reductase
VLLSRLVVIGGGAMGTALVGGILAAGGRTPDAVTVVEPDDVRRAAVADRFGVRTTADAADAVTDGDVATVLIAVKPQHVAAVLEPLAGCVDPSVLVLSIAAGVRTGAIEALLAADTPVVRAMPNTPALVGSGITAIAAGAAADDTDLDTAEELLSAVGRVVRVPEEQLDAVTGLSGSGPAYVFYVAEALIEGGVAMGLSQDVAAILAAETIVGAGRMLSEAGETPADLRAQVTSPGGTTAEGLTALERGAVRAAFLDAVRAATERSRQLGTT